MQITINIGYEESSRKAVLNAKLLLLLKRNYNIINT